MLNYILEDLCVRQEDRPGEEGAGDASDIVKAESSGKRFHSNWTPSF